LLHDAEQRLLAGTSNMTDPDVGNEQRALLLRTLNEVSATLGAASSAITQTWFTHVQELHTLNAGEVRA